MGRNSGGVRGSSGKAGGASTTVQNEALEYYVSGDGMYINQFLRNGEAMYDEDKKLLRGLDAATNKKISQDTLYRSVDASAIFGKMSDLEYDTFKSRLLYGKDEYDKKGIKEGIYNKVMAGAKKEYTEKGFMSTSTSRQIAEDWGDFSGSNKPIVMRITTSKNTRGADLTKHSMAQDEILLKRGQKYTLSKIYAKNGNIYVDVKLK